ncbi:putative Zn finger protein [Pseudoduganella flava]|uniref:Putative Zn finger protein n=1 Tax=Pseudoduganella flava TaxID=871742 RepID=A0A562PWZ2_9BURK|nr:DUF6880 family protein [Pseudoduganella flava]QGZ39774.1 hypothetical protein GO485_12415 [Pseudoduganella flava]TWI48690.1 putative Zn finger protein [Pseudoduganella flava]
MNIHDLITPATLRNLAGNASFTRGEEYVAAGAVRKLDCAGDRIRATVQGSTDYDVCVWVRDKALHFACSCPHAAQRSTYCKHFVAVGLAAIGAPTAMPAQPAPVRKRTRKSAADEDWIELDRYLRGLDADTLADLLLRAARDDRRLYAALVAQSTPREFDEAYVRKLIDEVTDLPEWVPQHEAGECGRAIERMLGKLEQLRTPATAPALVGLLEYAFERVEDALERVDDSGGEVGDLLLQIGRAHRDACTLARPDPVVLAERLFELAVRSGMGLWDFSPDNYAQALGEAGRQRYREVAMAAWRKLPLRGRDARADAIVHVMEALAADDIDLKVQVLSRDLGTLYRYRVIASALWDAGRGAEAVEWVRRGMRAFPLDRDWGLCDILVADHLAHGRGEQAIDIRLEQLEVGPTLHGYQEVVAAAQAAGQWPAARKRAWQAVERYVKRRETESRTVHVEIALWENDIDLAWQHALAGHCEAEPLQRLAEALEPIWPDDAFACYRRLIRLAMEQRLDIMQPVYASAFGYVQRILALLASMGRADEGAQYVQFLRNEYQRKRNFIKLLDSLP